MRWASIVLGAATLVGCSARGAGMTSGGQGTDGSTGRGTTESTADVESADDAGRARC